MATEEITLGLSLSFEDMYLVSAALHEAIKVTTSRDKQRAFDRLQIKIDTLLAQADQ